MAPAGHHPDVIFAFLSARVRRYVLFALLLPVAGRLLDTLGGRVARRNPQAGTLLRTAAGYARRPPRGVVRRYRRR